MDLRGGDYASFVRRYFVLTIFLFRSNLGRHPVDRGEDGALICVFGQRIERFLLRQASGEFSVLRVFQDLVIRLLEGTCRSALCQLLDRVVGGGLRRLIYERDYRSVHGRLRYVARNCSHTFPAMICNCCSARGKLRGCSWGLGSTIGLACVVRGGKYLVMSGVPSSSFFAGCFG